MEESDGRVKGRRLDPPEMREIGDRAGLPHISAIVPDVLARIHRKRLRVVDGDAGKRVTPERSTGPGQLDLLKASGSE